MTEQDPGNNPEDPRPPEYPNYPGPDAGQQPPPPPGYGQQPPPPPGYGQQPPPPPGYGQQPPPGYGPPQGFARGHGFNSGQVVPYASWWSRVGAYLLDGLMALAIAIVPIIIGAAITASTTKTSTDLYGNDQVVSGPNAIGVLFLILGYVLAIGFQIWNNGIRLGQQGQSIGQKILGIQVLRGSDGAVLGAGNGFLRLLMMAILGGLCFLNYLWPLWDQKKRAWHDMIVSSVVVRK